MLAKCILRGPAGFLQGRWAELWGLVMVDRVDAFCDVAARIAASAYSLFCGSCVAQREYLSHASLAVGPERRF